MIAGSLLIRWLTHNKKGGKIMSKHKHSQTNNSDSNYKGKGALDAFLNLLSLISLGWLAQAFGSVCFQLIGKYLGDINNAYSAPYYSESFLKYGIAALLVITPVYFAAVNILHLKYKKQELNHNSGIYRWLTYLMLLVSSLTIVGSLVALIASFLDGNYTSAFIAKVFTVIIIAGMIFGYYFYDLRRHSYNKKDLVSMIMAGVTLILVVAALIGGFMSIETPVQSRMRLEDGKTEEVLAQFVYVITGNYNTTQKLADSYDFQASLGGSNLPVGNVTYRKVSGQEFELCANFKAKAKNQYYSDKSYPWYNHDSGHQCYQLDAVKETEKYYKLNYQPVTGEMPAGTATAVKQ